MGGQKYKKEIRQEFEAIALIHLDSLYRTALFITKDEEEAKDLTQETFLKAYRFFINLNQEQIVRHGYLKYYKITI